MTTWTFVTNHARVFLAVAAGGDPTLRDIAEQLGITERAVHRIVSELADAGYVSRGREGRRNTYSLNDDLPMRAPELQDVEVSQLLAALLPERNGEGNGSREADPGRAAARRR
jgi:DNA-binding IclR family transcriptional regulator